LFPFAHGGFLPLCQLHSLFIYSSCLLASFHKHFVSGGGDRVPTFTTVLLSSLTFCSLLPMVVFCPFASFILFLFIAPVYWPVFINTLYLQAAGWKSVSPALARSAMKRVGALKL
jgi:hypothetical protein